MRLMWLLWAFVLYVLTALFGQWENSSRTSLFTLAAVGCCHILCLSLLASFFFLLLSCYLLVCGVPVELCLCCHNIQFPWDRAVYGKLCTKDIVPGQSDVLLSLKNSFELLQASGLRSYRPAFSIVVVTWYFMGPSLVFTETTRLYSLVFMGFHRHFCQMCFPCLLPVYGQSFELDTSNCKHAFNIYVVFSNYTVLLGVLFSCK